MNYDIDWLYKIFSYSSIQVKIIATLIGVLLFVFVKQRKNP